MPRCDSCHEQGQGPWFSIVFTDAIRFMVCSRCCPDPSIDDYTVEWVGLAIANN